MIKISIVTVCYNSEKFIEQTIISVLSQNYTCIEYILIDGGSIDNTIEIIKRYAASHPNVIKYLSEPDTGIYNAMNKGINMTSGEIVGVINSDDWYEPDAFQNVIESYREYGVCVYHGIQRTFNKEEVVGLCCTSSIRLNTQMIEHPTCFIPKILYRRFGLFNEQYQFVGDYELMLRLQRNQVPFIRIEKVLANFRQGGASHSFKAVQENYRLWRSLKILSNREYVYRSIMDKLKFYLGRGYRN